MNVYNNFNEVCFEFNEVQKQERINTVKIIIFVVLCCRVYNKVIYKKLFFALF